MEIGHLPYHAYPQSNLPAVVRREGPEEDPVALVLALRQAETQQVRAYVEPEPEVTVQGEWLGRADSYREVAWRAGQTYDAWPPGHPAAPSLLAQARQGLGVYAETARLAQRRVERGARIDAFA